MRIGYLVPQFPGSTHIFFWRELRALAEAGVECGIISTRLPPPALITHTWSQEAIERTTYLTPPRPALFLGGIWAIVRSGPAGWLRCARGVLGAQAPSLKRRVRMAGLMLMGAQVAHLARRRGWQHMHVHSCADSANIAMFARLIGGLPYSLTLHGHLGDYGLNQPAKWKHAAFGTVITRRLLGVLREKMNGQLPAVVEVAPMGVELETFRRTAPFEPWRGQGPCRIFSCGRLNPCKGHDHLIRAIGLLRDQGLDIQLRIAGADDSATGAHRISLEQLIAELGLGDRVTLLGAISEEAVREELGRAHVFALASRRDELGVATMEAMAMSLPVVVSRTGGVTEMVDDRVDGLLVDSDDPPAMAQGIARVLRDPELAGRLGGAARNKVEQAFHSRVSALVLLRCLQESMIARSGVRVASYNPSGATDAVSR